MKECCVKLIVSQTQTLFFIPFSLLVCIRTNTQYEPGAILYRHFPRRTP